MSKFGCLFLAMTAMPASADYREADALKYAYMSTAAMCSPGGASSDLSLLESWQCGPPCDAVKGVTDVRGIIPDKNNGAFAFVGRMGSICVMSFRGTSNIAGWISDAKSIVLVNLEKHGIPCNFNGRSCKVGDGFISNYNSMVDYLKGNLSDIGCGKGSQLLITGHSLGAATGAIAMFDFKQEGYNLVDSYTFGSPRVGDKTFVGAFEAMLEGIGYWRVTHADDPVPHMPFEVTGFHHLPTEVYYKKEVSDGFKICDGNGEDRHCCNRHAIELPASILKCGVVHSQCPHDTYMRANKTSSMLGDTCIEKGAQIV